MKIGGYIRGKTRTADDSQVITLIYHTLKNSEIIGVTGMDEELLLRRVSERLAELRLEYQQSQLDNCLTKLISKKVLIRNNEGKVELV